MVARTVEHPIGVGGHRYVQLLLTVSADARDQRHRRIQVGDSGASVPYARKLSVVVEQRLVEDADRSAPPRHVVLVVRIRAETGQDVLGVPEGSQLDVFDRGCSRRRA